MIAPGDTKKAIQIIGETVVRGEREGKVDYTTLYNMAVMYNSLAADPANGIEPNRQVKFYELALKAKQLRALYLRCTITGRY